MTTIEVSHEIVSLFKLPDPKTVKQVFNILTKWENKPATSTNDVLINAIIKANSMVSPVSIITECCKYFNLKPLELKSKTRHRSIAYPRQVAAYLLCKHTKLSLGRVATELNQTCHSTIIHSRRFIESQIPLDKRVRYDVENLEILIKQPK